MTIFKSFTLTWWQAGLFKLCLLSLGAAIGAHWADYFTGLIPVLLAVAVILGLYLVSVWAKSP